MMHISLNINLFNLLNFCRKDGTVINPILHVTELSKAVLKPFPYDPALSVLNCHSLLLR